MSKASELVTLEPVLEQAIQAVAAAGRHLDKDARPAHVIVDVTSALETIDAIEAGLFRSSVPPGDGVALGLRSARADLLSHQLARQRQALPALMSGLSQLRSATSIDTFVESIPIHVTELGYDRAMFSWVRKEHWVPRSMHCVGNQSEARAALKAGAPYRHTRGLYEIDVVRNRDTILVLDADGHPRVHPEITAVTRSKTYVAAPVVARQHVAGMVHLDRNVETGLNDDFDRELLALFCESIGAVLDQLLSQEQADGVDPAGATDSAGATVTNVPDWVEALTGRERDVLRLLAGGLTNAQIGSRLFISEETTKSHVKSLLRKLGVINRAQAAAHFHRHHAAISRRHLQCAPPRSPAVPPRARER